MKQHRQEWEPFYDYGPPYMMGTASPTAPPDDPDEVIKRLHAVIEEITGSPAREPKARQRMGFL